MGQYITYDALGQYITYDALASMTKPMTTNTNAHVRLHAGMPMPQCPIDIGADPLTLWHAL